MAINKLAESTEEQLSLTINNGDFAALKKVRELYNLKDESSVIAFALGVLSQSNGQGVTITKDTGSVAKLIPSDDLKS